MGQYHKLVCLNTQQYLHPHKLGAGLKAIEGLWAHSYTAALIPLIANSHLSRPGDMYSSQVTGEWAGGQIAVIGDYAEDRDIPGYYGPRLSRVYGLCESPPTIEQFRDEPEPGAALLEAVSAWNHETRVGDVFRDRSEDVVGLVESALGGRFVGSGWRRFIPVKREGDAWVELHETGFTHTSTIDRPPAYGRDELLDEDVADGSPRMIVNFDKREVIDPAHLGVTATVAGVMRSHLICATLFSLLLHPHRRGGGDLTRDEAPEIGRWAGNRIGLFELTASEKSIYTDITEAATRPIQRLLA